MRAHKTDANTFIRPLDPILGVWVWIDLGSDLGLSELVCVDLSDQILISIGYLETTDFEGLGH